MKFAVQLYSLRELAAREGAEAVLRTVAQAGYDGVEFAGEQRGHIVQFYLIGRRQQSVLVFKRCKSRGIGIDLKFNLDYLGRIDFRRVLFVFVNA